MTKAMKGIGVIKRLSKMLPQHSLLTIYKSFVQPHLDYGDILYDQPNNKSLCQKIKTVQYIAALVITSAIKGTSQIKLYIELGLESLEFRWWWFRKLCFIRLKKLVLPEYLLNMIPQSNHQYNTWLIEDVTTFYCRTYVLKYSYFPHTILDGTNRYANKTMWSWFSVCCKHVHEKITWHICLFYSIFSTFIYSILIFFFSFKNHFCFISYSFLTCFLYNLNK